MKYKRPPIEDLQTGMRISRAMITDVAVTDGVIHRDDWLVFICQNEFQGDTASDLHGYRFSWRISGLPVPGIPSFEPFYMDNYIGDLELMDDGHNGDTP